MVKKIDFSGIHIPIITPFSNDGKKVDEEALRKLVNYLIKEQKASGLVPCGTTGESPTLNYEEHERVVEIVIDEAKHRVPIIAGTGSNSTAEAIEMTRKAEEAGADATLQVGPYYNKPTQEGLLAHFKAIAASTELPILIYNIPGRTSKNIEPKTILKLWQDCENIAGLKDSCSDINQTMEIIKATRNQAKPFCVLTGEDALTYSTLALGGRGAISAAAHVVGKEYSEMTKLMLDRKEKDYQKKALDIHYSTIELVKNLFIEPNPVPVKAAYKMMGLLQNETVRLPLIEMQQANKEILRQSLAKLGKL